MSVSVSEARERVKQWVDQSKTLRIFVFGKLGSGKSSLINSLLNKEVAKEDDSLYAVTQDVQQYSGVKDTVTTVPELSMTIHDVQVTLWDTPGLEDPYTNKECLLLDITAKVKGNVDLYVYCTPMTQMRAESGDFNAITDLTKVLGADFWKSTFFVMTFANKVTLPQNSSEKLEVYFNKRLEQWKKILRDAVQKADSNIPQSVIKNIPVIPTGYRDSPLPGNMGHWFTDFWSTCISRMKFMSIPALLTVNQEGWIDNATNQVITQRVISQRLVDIGDTIEDKFSHEVAVKLSQVPQTYFMALLKAAIQGSMDEADYIPQVSDYLTQDDPQEPSFDSIRGERSNLIPWTNTLLFFGVGAILGLLLIHIYRSKNKV